MCNDVPNAIAVYRIEGSPSINGNGKTGPGVKRSYIYRDLTRYSQLASVSICASEASCVT